MDEKLSNFNSLGLIPLPSIIEALDSKFHLNKFLYLDFDGKINHSKILSNILLKNQLSLVFILKMKILTSLL